MDNNVAKIIADQIGPRALMMLGAKSLMGSPDSLKFRIGKNAKRVTTIVVRLADDDTYSIQFWQIRGTFMKLLNTVDGVYVDSLHTTIETNTGLYTSL